EWKRQGHWGLFAYQKHERRREHGRRLWVDGFEWFRASRRFYSCLASWILLLSSSHEPRCSVPMLRIAGTPVPALDRSCPNHGSGYLRAHLEPARHHTGGLGRLHG